MFRPKEWFYLDFCSPSSSLDTSVVFSFLLPSHSSVPARLCKFAPDNSGRIVPASGVVAAAVAVTACYSAGVMTACLILFPSCLPPFFPFLPSVSGLLPCLSFISLSFSPTSGSV